MVRQQIKFNKGVVLVELLVAFGLASILLPALLTGFVGATQGREVYEQRIAASALVREAEEVIRSFRNEKWSNVANLTAGINYYPSISGSKWTLLPGNESIPNTGFTRTIVVADVYRDAGQNIVAQGAPGAILDPSTRQFLITVSWPGYFTRSITSSLYITRYGNKSLAETQTVSAPSGGFEDWCKPALSLTNVNLDRQGHATSVSAFESGNGTGNRVLTGTGANASGPDFSNIIIQGNSPPSLISDTDYNGNPQLKANGVFGDTNFAFLATNKQGVVILDLRTALYQQIGSFNPTSGNIHSNSVYVVGNTGYLVTDNKFYIFSISVDRRTTAQTGSVDLANGIKVVVDASGQYAYVANPDPSGELKIIDVHSHPTTLTYADIKNVDVDGAAGRDVFINPSATRAYLATATSATQPEFFIINISDKANPVVITSGGTYDTNGMDPHGVTIVSGQRAIIVGEFGHEYQVFVVADDQVSSCPNHSENNDFLDVNDDTGFYGVASLLQSDQHAYSYIVTGDAGAELKIVEGGSGSGGAGGNGTYESPTLPVPDPGHDVAFNSFTATVDPNLSYKISIKHGVGGSCSSVTFSDSDFTPFVPGPLPLTTLGAGYTNPGECLRYRAINSGSSPITFTATFNYSP